MPVERVRRAVSNADRLEDPVPTGDAEIEHAQLGGRGVHKAKRRCRDIEWGSAERRPIEEGECGSSHGVILAEPVLHRR
jgi:hypothetical protein